MPCYDSHDQFFQSSLSVYATQSDSGIWTFNIEVDTRFSICHNSWEIAIRFLSAVAGGLRALHRFRMRIHHFHIFPLWVLVTLAIW